MGPFTIYGDVYSGNCLKVLIACRHLDLDYRWQVIDILKGEARTAAFRARNPNIQVPLLELPDGRHLAESNAILNFLAEGTPLLPDDRWLRAQVLQWQFFEQYSHEPAIAVARFIRLYLGLPAERQDEYDTLQERGHHALQVMEQHLSTRSYFVGEAFSIADISLYAYTHRADEGGFDLGAYPAVQAWLARVAAQAGPITMEAAAAAVGQTHAPAALALRHD